MLSHAERALTEAGVASPRTDAEVLLAHVLDVPRGRLLLVDELPVAKRHHYEQLVARRAAREPLQHLTGRVAFRGVELAVGPGVFVPRPETEPLAGWAGDALRRLLADAVREPVAVDLCAGSGAIAAALADEVPGARLHAVEASPAAYAYAERNLRGTGVDLRLGDIEQTCGDLDGTVDVVVANPPYIPLGAFESVQIEARAYDPAVALWSGTDGLDAVRAVERAAARLLRPGGVLGCEHADVQGGSVPAILAGAGRWAEVCDHDDLAGRSRFTTAVASSPVAGWHDGRRE
ncbi:peptide chain release factor N(5)-glutamine methyltransferase [soil metagenome]